MSSLSASKRQSLVLELSTYRPVLAERRRVAIKSADLAATARVRSLAAEEAHDDAQARYHWAEYLRQDRASRDAYESRAVILGIVRWMEQEISRC